MKNDKLREMLKNRLEILQTYDPHVCKLVMCASSAGKIIDEVFSEFAEPKEQDK